MSVMSLEVKAINRMRMILNAVFLQRKQQKYIILNIGKRKVLLQRG